jgi:hypothetical protein
MRSNSNSNSNVAVGRPNPPPALHHRTPTATLELVHASQLQRWSWCRCPCRVPSSAPPTRSPGQPQRRSRLTKTNSNVAVGDREARVTGPAMASSNCHATDISSRVASGQRRDRAGRGSASANSNVGVGAHKPRSARPTPASWPAPWYRSPASCRSGDVQLQLQRCSWLPGVDCNVAIGLPTATPTPTLQLACRWLARSALDRQLRTGLLDRAARPGQRRPVQPGRAKPPTELTLGWPPPAGPPPAGPALDRVGPRPGRPSTGSALLDNPIGFAPSACAGASGLRGPAAC